MPSWVDAAEDAVLSTLRQEKRATKPKEAWWTCERCPQRLRYLKGKIWYAVHSYTIDVGATRSEYPVEIHEGNEWELPEKYMGFKVKRCKQCNRNRDRHHRAKRSLGTVLEKQMRHLGTSARFVTLSVPNEFIPIKNGIIEPDHLTRLVRELKAKMYAFTRTVAYQDKVIGAVEFYEQTYTIHDDEVEVNTHIHAVWLGEYWDQASLQDAWGAIVHISKPESKKAVMKYISKYVTKDPVPGTRAKETRGVLRKS